MCTRNFCDYDKYYFDQAGGKLDISYYTGYPYQRGYGRFSAFAKRYGVPALKYLLKQGVEFGKDLYQHFRAGKPIPEAIKTSAKKRVSSALKDLDEHINPNQTGSGLRKKPRFHIPKKISKKKSIKKIKKSKRKRKSKSKDIFI